MTKSILSLIPPVLAFLLVINNENKILCPRPKKSMLNLVIIYWQRWQRKVWGYKYAVSKEITTWYGGSHHGMDVVYAWRGQTVFDLN